MEKEIDGEWKYGYIDKTGTEALPFIYDDADSFSDGYAVVAKNNRYGVIDATGKEILPCSYLFITLEGNVAKVRTSEDLTQTETIYLENSVEEQKNITVLFNGNEIEFDQPPIIENDRTLVPFRKISEALGAEVDWNDETKQATAVLGATEIVFTIDKASVMVNGTEKAIDQPPVIKNDRILLPARAFAEELGANVLWDGETQTVTITK